MTVLTLLSSEEIRLFETAASIEFSDFDEMPDSLVNQGFVDCFQTATVKKPPITPGPPQCCGGRGDEGCPKSGIAV